MALIAHWPLDGRLDDVVGGVKNKAKFHAGLNDTGVSFVSTDGLTGTSFFRTGLLVADGLTISRDVMELEYKRLSSLSRSIFFRLKLLHSSGTNQRCVFKSGLDSAGYQIAVFLKSVESDYKICIYFTDKDGVKRVVIDYESITIEENVWLSFSIILDKGKLILYKNTIQILETLLPDIEIQKFANNYFSIGNEASFISRLNGYIESFMIFNHSISQIEVNEINKYKILHLKFNDIETRQYNDAMSQTIIVAREGIVIDRNSIRKTWNHAFVSGTTSTGAGRKGVFTIPVIRNLLTEDKYSVSIEFRIINDSIENYNLRLVTNNMTDVITASSVENHLYKFENISVLDTLDICLYSKTDDYTIPADVEILWRHIQLEPFNHCTKFVNKPTGSNKFFDSSYHRNECTLGGMRYIIPVHNEIDKSLTFFNDGRTNTRTNVHTSVFLNNMILDSNEFEITISCRVRTKDVQGYGCFLGASSYNGIGLTIHENKYKAFCRTQAQNSQNMYLEDSEAIVNDDKFHNLAIIVSRKTKSFKFYADGRITEGVPIENNFVNSLSTMRFNIMGMIETSGEGPWLNGNIEIADVQIHRKALNKIDIDSLFKNKIDITSSGSIKTKYLNNTDNNLVNLDPPEYIFGKLSGEDAYFNIFANTKNDVLLRGFSADSYSMRLPLEREVKAGENIEITFSTIGSDNISSSVEVEIFVFTKKIGGWFKTKTFVHSSGGSETKHKWVLTTERNLNFFRLDVNNASATILFKNIIIKTKKDVGLSYPLNTNILLNRKPIPQTNILEYLSWRPNTVGECGYWGVNGNIQNDDIKRMIKLNPWNEMDIVWASEFNDPESNADGGFGGYSDIPLDNTKKYRYSCWVRRENIGNGRCHFGPKGEFIEFKTGLLNKNPYFVSPIPDEYGENVDGLWMLMVYYILPYDATVDDTTSGFYKVNGSKVSVVESVGNYKFTPGTKSFAVLVAYLYYSISVSERCYWYRPRIDLCDGTEPTIDDLLNGREHGSIIEALGKFNPTFPPDEQFIEIKRAHGARWGKIFYHNNKAGTVLFNNDFNNFLRCDTEDKKSILYALPHMRDKNYKFEFLLEYDSFEGYNRWKQSSIFTKDTVVTGYEPVYISWTSCSWGGLGKTDRTNETYVDGSIDEAGGWYFSIGTKISYKNGSPGPIFNSSETAGVHLWVRLPEVAWFTPDNELVVNEIEPI